jgi:hypothetical protein
VKGARRLGDSISSGQTYVAAIFRSTLLMFRRVKLTRTRSSCNRMDQMQMEEPILSRSRSCQGTSSSPCRTEEAANPLEVDEVCSSYARRSMTKLSVGIVSLKGRLEVKAVRRLGDSISSHRTYTSAIFRSPLLTFRRVKLTRTRTSCNRMDQIGTEEPMEEPILSRSRGYQKTSSSPCRTEEVVSSPEVDEAHSSYARRSTTKLSAGIVCLKAGLEVKVVRRLGDSTSSDRTCITTTFRYLLLICRSVVLTRTRSSCNRMDQIELEEPMEEPIPSRSRGYQKTTPSLCRTEEAANPPEVDGVHSSYVRRSMTKLSAGIVCLKVGLEVKAIRQLGDSTSSDRTYTDVIFRSPCSAFQRMKLTKTRSSCIRMGQV